MKTERLERPKKPNHYTVRVTTILPNGGSIEMTLTEVPEAAWLEHYGSMAMLNCFPGAGVEATPRDMEIAAKHEKVITARRRRRP